MTQVTAVQGATPTEEPGRRTVRSAFRSLELDTRLLGMIVALALIWVGFNILSGGLFMTPAQPLEPVGPVGIGGDHGHRHGPGHRLAQHRPVHRLRARPDRHGDGHAPGGVDPQDVRPRLRPAVDLDRRRSPSDSSSGPSSGPSTASSSPTSAFRRSSSRSAGCWSGVASPSSWPRARRSRRWIRRSRCSEAGPRARSGRR